MAISNVGVNPLANSAANLTVGNVTPRIVDGGQGQVNANQQPSATVTLSAQGQKLSQTQTQTNPIESGQTQTSQSQTTNTVDTVVTPNAVPQSKETTTAPGIQFMTGERKSGRVNTFA